MMIKTSLLQAQQSQYIDKDIFNVCATIFGIALLMAFALSIIRMLLAHRLKKAIIDKGTDENTTGLILRSTADERGDPNLKWFAILTGTGIGLTVVNYTLPLGVHSLAILCFSIAAGFLAYFLYTKFLKNKI